MHHHKIWILVSSLLLGSVACDGDGDAPPDRVIDTEPARAVPRLIQQIAPPIDLEAPPADATRTASGLSYKKLVTKEAGAQAKASGKVLVHYTGWRQRTGETFFTTQARGRPIALDIAHAAPGFAEALPRLRKGEKVMLWVPPSASAAETLVYEVEIVDVMPPHAIAKQTSQPDSTDTQGPRRQSRASDTRDAL